MPACCLIGWLTPWRTSREARSLRTRSDTTSVTIASIKPGTALRGIARNSPNGCSITFFRLLISPNSAARLQAAARRIRARDGRLLLDERDDDRRGGAQAT